MSKKQVETFQRPFVYGVFGLGFLNLLLFGDLFFNADSRVLSSSQADLYLHFAAWRQFGFDQLRHGHLVLWNPHYLCGAPFLGNFESALLYPPNWLYLILPLVSAINVGVIVHVFLAGFFTYLWAHRRGFHPLSCFVAGTVFMFGGAYFLHLFAGHLPNLCTMVWAPLIFLTIDALVDEFSVGWILFGVFAVSMQILAGHPQYVYFTAIIAGIYVLLNLISLSHKSKFKIIGSAIAIYMGASMITAVQLWTGLQALSECGRRIPLEYRSAGSFSFPPENLITLVLPEFFGNLTSVHYWGRWFLWEDSIFIGVTAFFLFLFALGAGASPKRHWAFTTAVIAFVLSLGVFTPLFGFLYYFVPGFNGLRGICKFDFLVCLFLAMLTGEGFDYLIKNKKIPGWPAFLMTFTGILATALGFLIAHSIQDGLKGSWAEWFTSVHWLKKTVFLMDLTQKEDYMRQSGLRSASSLWIGAGTCFLLSMMLGLRNTRRKIVYTVAALAIIELFTFARLNRPTFELSSLQKKFDQIQSLYKGEPGEYRVYGTGSDSLVTGGYDIWEDEPMVLGRYGRFVCYSQGLSENQLFSVLPIFKRFHPVFGMIRLKYRVFTDRDPVQFYPMPFKTLPRMLLLNQWRAIPDRNQLLPALFDPRFDPSQKVYLEKTPDPPPEEEKVKGTIEWEDLSTDKIEIRADVPKASLLLVTDNYSKGWSGVALSDSVQTHYQVMPGNYFLQVIPLSAGKHHFILEYLPAAFLIGKWVSVLSGLLYVVILILHLRKNPLLKRK